jgi:hypothetical protein
MTIILSIINSHNNIVDFVLDDVYKLYGASHHGSTIGGQNLMLIQRNFCHPLLNMVLIIFYNIAAPCYFTLMGDFTLLSNIYRHGQYVNDGVIMAFFYFLP